MKLEKVEERSRKAGTEKKFLLLFPASEDEAGYFYLLEGRMRQHRPCPIQEPMVKSFFLQIKAKKEAISQRCGFFKNYLGLN